MKRKKQILVFMILFSLIINLSNGAVSNAAETNIVTGKCGDNVYYELNKTTGVLRIYGSGAMDEYNVYSVSTPPPWRKEYRSIITKVKVEYGVTTIGRDSFRGSPYNENEYYKNLTSVEIASTVKDIGGCAFGGCINLKTITIPDSVKVIGSSAFAASGLTNVRMGRSVQTIGRNAFSGTYLTELNLPPSVQTVGAESFYYCPKLKYVEIPGNCEVGYRAFADCAALNNVVFGKNCKIYGEVFKQCSQLSQITLGEGSVGVTGIMDGINYRDAYGAFNECTGLKSIRLPDSWGFYDGTEDTWAYNHQFNGCTNLRNISFNNTNNKYTIMDGVVYSKDKRELVYYPFYLTAAEYEMPDSITTIAPYAFKGQEHIEHVLFSSNINKIGWGAFWGCSKLNNVILSEGLTELTGSVFVYCTNLKSIVLPASIEKIDLNYKAGSHSFGSETMSVLNSIYGEKNSYIEQWAGEKFKKTIYCSFDANGGITDTEKIPVIYGDKYHRLPVPEREGYKFSGWYTKKDSGNEVSGDTLVSTDISHTLYAHWERNSKYNYTIDSLTYNFSNSKSGFGYSPIYKIPYSSYKIIYGDTVKAKYFYNNAGLWGGSCYGMASTSGMFNYPYSGLGVKQFNMGASKVHDLRISDKDDTDMTITELIEAMHVSQYDTPIQKAYRSTTNSMEELYEQVCSVRETGKPVLIGVFGPQGGHALLGYDIEKISDTETYLYVYDCNFPYQNRHITLSTDTSGKISGWYYYLNDLWHWGSEYEGCKINYVTYDNYYSEWENRAVNQDNNILFLNSKNVAIYDSDNRLIATLQDGKLYTVNKDIYIVEQMEINADSTQSGKDTMMIYLPSDMYTVKNNNSNSTEEFQASMVGVDRGATVSTSSNEIMFAVNDISGMNNVSVKTGNGDTYNIVLDSTAEIDDEHVEVSGISKGNVVSVSQIEGNLSLSNCEGASVSVNGKNITESKNKVVTVSPKPNDTLDTTTIPGLTDEPDVMASPMAGTVLSDNKNNVSYKVIAQGKTVAFYKVDNKETTKAVIPNTVTINGIKYKVTAISDNAFSGCKKLKYVTIGKNVATIGNSAFFQCTSLKKIVIPVNVVKIGKKAFYGCKELKSITIKTKKIKSKSVGIQAFKGIHKKAIIKVPKTQKNAYKKWLKKKGVTKAMKIK